MVRIMLFALLTAACNQGSPTLPQTERREATEAVVAEQSSKEILPTGATLVPDVVSIAGEWRVAGVGEQALGQPFGISASIGDGRIRFVSQCLSRTYALSIENGVAATRLVPNEEPECARALTIDERALEQAMRQVTSAYRLPSNALVLDGPAGAVTMFTQ